MADSDKTVTYNIDANADGFTGAMDKARAAAKQSAEQIQGSWGAVAGHFKAATGAIAGLMAVIAGGAGFKHAIDETKRLNGETMGLAKTFNLSGDEAAALNTALGDIYTDSETYIGTFQKFAKVLKNNEDGLNDMGIKTRDANGHLRDSNTLYTEALQKVGEYRPGLDQTTAAMTLFGKGVDDVMKLQKLNNKVIEDARAKNEALGLTITQEGLEATKKYKAAMNDMGDVMTAIMNVIGKALMPIFTRLAEWFSDAGPAAVFVFKVAIDALATALQAVVLIVKVTWNFLRALADPLFVFGGAIKKLISGDLKGATDDMMSMGDSWKGQWAGLWDKIKEDATRSWTEVTNLWSDGTKVEKPKGGTKTMPDFSEKKKQSRMPEWDAQLQERKLVLQEQAQAEGRFAEMSKADERAFWQDKLSLTKAGSAEQTAVRHKVATVALAIMKDDFETEVATLEAKTQAFKNNLDARRDLIEQEANLVAQMYGKDSKEYQAVQGKLTALAREAAAQRVQVEEVTQQRLRTIKLAEIEADASTIHLQEQLQLISHEQALQAQMQFEERRYQINQQALQDKLKLLSADPDRNPAELARLNGELEALELQHQQALRQIKGDLTTTQLEPLVNTYKAAEQAMGAAINGLLSRTMSMGQAMRTIWQGISGSIIGEISKILAKKAAAWALEKALALASIGTKAVEAGAGAASAVADIPIVGPAMAIAAMVAVMGAVMGMKSNVPSARMGYDIPAGLNPLTQLHEKEMVLPAKQADVIRAMADSGGAGSSTNVSIEAHPMPGNYFMVHRDQLVKALQSAVRDNAWKPKV